MQKETVDEIVGRALRGEPYVPTCGGDDAPAQPAAPQGVAYAELPEPIWRTAQGVAFSERQLYDFADRTHALRVSHGQAPAGAWIERWYGSGGKDGYEGWSIVNKDGRCLVAYLGRNVESGAVTEIVMAHNATLTTPTAQPAPATQQAGSGWKLVPVDVTDDMLAAFAKGADSPVDWHGATEAERQDVRDGFGPAYRAMLAAAPQSSPTPPAEKAAPNAAPAWGHHARKLTQWLHCMSHNDSYFGEPAGLVKQVTGELNRLICPALQQEAQEPHGWLYDWTHSSATGKPDTTYTGFTKDEAHARKHDNCTAVFTTPQPAPATQQAGVSLRRIERTTFPSSPAHRVLSAFCGAMSDSGIDGADMRAAMLWFLGYEETYASPTAQAAPALAENGHLTQAGHDLLMETTLAGATLVSKGRFVGDMAQAAPAADPAYSEACSLANALFEKHYRQEPDYASGRVVWSLCDTTAGVISQIDNMVSGLARAPAAGAVAGLTREQIRDVFLANGFTVKEGQRDLKPYVYAAAEALLALAASTPAAPADSVMEDAAREAVRKVLDMFPFNATKQGFSINGGPSLSANGDTEFYSVKMVLEFLTAIKTTLDAARKQGGTHDNH